MPFSFKKWFTKKRKLTDLIAKHLEQEEALAAKKQCFFYFLVNELAYVSGEIERKLLTRNSISIEVPEAFGFSYFIEHLRGVREEHYGEQTLYLRLNEQINDANLIALIILREFGQSPHGDPLSQLRKYFQGQRSLVILEGIASLSNLNLRLLLEALSTSKLILIDYDLQRFEAQNGLIDEVLVIPPLSPERAVALILALLNYRTDLIITSADRQELIMLAEYCAYLPEMIYLVLSDFQATENTKSVEQIASSIASLQSKTPDKPYQAVLAHLWGEFPDELTAVLRIVNHLPHSGFSLNDLMTLGADQNFTFKEAQLILDILTNQAGLRQFMAKDVIVYQVPYFIRAYLDSLFGSSSGEEQARLDKLLFQRLESHQIWNQPFLWISQLEQTLFSIRRIAAGDFLDRNPYTLLYLQSILLDFGFWREIDLYLVPVCRKTISCTDNNEERGYWYSLLGMMHKGIAQYKDPAGQVDLALESFQRALKFYNPQKQIRKCSFVNQNIGSLYFELAQLDPRQKMTHLKAALKYLQKAYSADPGSVTLARQIGQAHMLLGVMEKPSENFEKALFAYLKALDIAKKQHSMSKARYVQLQLDLLLSHVSQSFGDLSRDEKERLSLIKHQIEGLLDGVFRSTTRQLG
ncbi:MAG: hypothetical protein SFT81_07855 [Candidatus Caenarcaniphilales bacterium]|nr:hypothetical protein [Candidatus Caenarcaniphilales bacterium]